MAFSSGLAIGLSILFGFVLIAFVAELYYLLWWKKKREDIENQDSSSSSNYTPTPLFCFKNPNSSRIPKTHEKDLQNCVDESEDHEKQQEPHQKDLQIKGFGEESLDLELMRLHNLCGPPRFLFTINEETKEDLELESRKGGSRMSLSELLCTPETSISSPSPLKTSQASNLEGYLNPLYDYNESNEFDFNKIRSSPPPTFKFLRDAEEKLLKRLMQLEAEKRASLKKNQDHHHQMSTPSQILPLASSPSN
ncbi:hypothetical protein L1987_50866 [Smallanthus sonchifolius]|uniref:Uncharacterized protein n=1 Tax=Smallanthus sonchifolius TaxID=185202 RepID=A0ACB9EP20_9ASTR|nr:hypothetical protein L1987_50866 [Smallanthus sonchifolius]